MAKKKPENKQIQVSKQNINITIGDKVVKRKRRGRPRKQQAKTAKGSIISGGFTTPIINYPPTYVNPAVVQPVQQPQSNTLVPKVPAGVPPTKQPRGYAVFPEGETAPLLGLGTDPLKLDLGKNEPVKNVEPFSRRLAVAAQEAKLEQYKAPKPLKKSKEEFHAKAENSLGGIDTNIGDAYEPEYGGLVRRAGEPIDPLTASLRETTEKQAYGSWKALYQEGLTTGQQRRQPLPPINIRPPDYPPPLSGLPEEEYISSRRGRPKGSKNRPKGAGKEFPSRSQELPVEPFGSPPEEGIRFLGSSTAPAEAPPSLERQRGEGITPIEATFLSA
jgi:hypothetical protein